MGRSRAGIHAQKNANGIGTFLVLPRILQIIRFARLKPAARRVVGKRDEILAFLLFGQVLEQIDDLSERRRITHGSESTQVSALARAPMGFTSRQRRNVRNGQNGLRSSI